MATKWRKKHGRLVATRPALPGVRRIRGGGWYIRGSATDQKTGRKRWVDRFLDDVRTPEEALQILRREQEQLRRTPRPTRSSRIRFGDFAVSLLERKIEDGEILSEKNIMVWRSTLEHHLLPHFGEMYLDAITRDDIRMWMGIVQKRIRKQKNPNRMKKVLAAKERAKENRKRKRQGKKPLVRKRSSIRYSPHSANVWWRTLNTILQEAAEEFDWTHDPMRGVKKFNTRGHRTTTVEEPNHLKPEHLQPFLDRFLARYPQHYGMATLGFCLGLRPSSLRPLRRRGAHRDILWDKGILLIRRSHTVGQEVMDETKTGLDLRLHLPTKLIDVLRWHVESLPEGPMRDSDLLFPSTKGGFRSAGVLDKPFFNITLALQADEDLDFDYWVSPKGMRRTFQDLARAAQVSELVTRSISGHLTEAMHHHYSTVGGEEQREALAKVVDLAGFRAQLGA